MKACADWKDRLMDLAAGESGETETRAVELHLNGCAGCAQSFAELRERAERLDAALPLLAERAEISPGFEARLMAKIESQHESHWSAGNWVKWWPRLVATGVVCAVMVAGLASSGVSTMVRGWWRGEPEVSISTWRSPTENLLEAPGESLLRSGPRVGEVYFPVQTARRGTNK